MAGVCLERVRGASVRFESLLLLVVVIVGSTETSRGCPINSTLLSLYGCSVRAELKTLLLSSSTGIMVPLFTELKLCN